jgi:hypothetical protein
MTFHHVGPRPLGTFKKVPGGLTHQLVTVDKFIKWIEARPLAKIGELCPGHCFLLWGPQLYHHRK